MRQGRRLSGCSSSCCSYLKTNFFFLFFLVEYNGNQNEFLKNVKKKEKGRKKP